MSSTTFALRPCLCCGGLPQFSYKATPGRAVVLLSCECYEVQAASDAAAAAAWNMTNWKDDTPRE
jgi:hypothetical protein